MTSTHSDPLNTLPEDLGNKASDLAENLSATLEETAGKMRTLKDELAVRLHLATREAHDLRDELLQSVDQLGQRFSELATTFDQKLDQSQLQIHLGLMNAKQRWEMTREEAERVFDMLKSDQSKAKHVIDEARLQARLAKLETQEFVSESQREISTSIKELGKQSSQTLKRINSSVSEFLHNLG